MSDTPKLSRLMRSGYWETALFWYIWGIKTKLPGTTNTELFRSFRKEANVSDEEFSDSAMKKAFERQQERYYEHLRSDG